MNNLALQALVMMLKNTKENTYHPIFYLEDPFPHSSAGSDLLRYKSKGHRTVGFTERQDAINSIELEVKCKVKELGYNFNEELEGNIEWDGTGIPADVQIRSRKDL